jgi:peptide subunit release factor 1 (eRF1)
MPNDLADKLVDMAPDSTRDRQTEVIILTLSSFIEQEEHQHRTIAERLIEGLRSQNLAVAGSAATLDALRRGEVDTLVMASSYQPDPGWTCTACRAIGTELPETSVCPQCGNLSVRPMDVRETLMHLAGQLELPVEVVEHSDELLSLDGVGCLLRTHLDTQINKYTVAAVATG